MANLLSTYQYVIIVVIIVIHRIYTQRVWKELSEVEWDKKKAQ